MLRQLLYEDRRLVDGWDKSMSIYPLEDWPFFERRRQAERRRLGDPSRPATAILPQVRAEIEARGPLSSIDLAFDEVVKWSWSPTRIARAALESMYHWGELIVHHKVHTRKVYDFGRHHIPKEVLSAPDPNLSHEDYVDWYVLRRLRNVGLVWHRPTGGWHTMHGVNGTDREEALVRLTDRGAVIRARVEGQSLPFHIRRDDLDRINLQGHGDEGGPQAAIMAPLDNLLWDRQLVEALFNFRYRWEVYKPAVEREYGYYVLPVLYGDRFVARFEPTRDRESDQMFIKNWWWEADVVPDEEMRSALTSCMSRFLDFLGLSSLAVSANAEHADVTWLSEAVPAP